MDIQGLVNHTNGNARRPGSSSPQDNSGSDSARSHHPIDSGASYLPAYSLSSRDRDREELYSPLYQLHNSSEWNPSPPLKRQLDGVSPTLSLPQPKRRVVHEANGDGSKVLPTRRRALQACEACRAKKSKCDNERPSCGSCLQHGVECIYKGTPFVPV
jgi:Fungal Zn(2)-Cys(6) binuclear cluster domain